MYLRNFIYLVLSCESINVAFQMKRLLECAKITTYVFGSPLCQVVPRCVSKTCTKANGIAKTVCSTVMVIKSFMYSGYSFY